MYQSKRILVCPLNWGLGHASRMIPLISELIESGHQVIIGAEDGPLSLIRSAFPEIEVFNFPSFSVNYSAGSSLVLSMLKQSPKFLTGIAKEHHELKKIIKNKNIDIVISDNRFGLWNKKVKTIFITHQVNIKIPAGIRIMKKPVSLINKKYINKFDECWIPDFPGELNLSGELSHNISLKCTTRYIGILSHLFHIKEKPITQLQLRDQFLLAVLSGPEPQRSILEKILIDEISKTKMNAVIVQGLPREKLQIKQDDNIQIISFLGSSELKYLIQKADTIICRSGYSSIMDLVALNKTAILIPTPGQTEQEYLAEYLSGKKRFIFCNQNTFNLQNCLTELSDIDLSSLKTNNNPFLKEVVKTI